MSPEVLGNCVKNLCQRIFLSLNCLATHFNTVLFSFGRQLGFIVRLPVKKKRTSWNYLLLELTTAHLSLQSSIPVDNNQNGDATVKLEKDAVF